MTGWEIAKHAGVGYATVTRVLSGNPKYSVSDKMRERVHQAVRELGYIPNPFSRALGSKRSYIIGLCDPLAAGRPITWIHVDHRLEGMRKNPLSQQYYFMVMLRSGDSRKMEHYVMRGVQYLDGMIYVSPQKKELKMLQGIAKKIPLVVEQGFDMPGVCTVSVNQRLAIEDSVKRLNQRGSKNLGLVLHLSPDYYHNRIRVESFRKAVASLGLTLNEDWIVHCPEGEAVYRSVGKMVRSKNRIDGIIVPRDHELIRAVDAIRDAGLRLGRDVRLISMNETDTALNLQPGISAIHFPLIDIANQCFNLLMQQIEGTLEEKPHMLIPAKLIERESTLNRNT